MSDIHTHPHPTKPHPFIRGCQPEDILDLTKALGPSDPSIMESLLVNCSPSPYALTIERDGRAVAVFGVHGIPGESGSPWFFGTTELGHCRDLLGHARAIVDIWTEQYRNLSGSIPATNADHVEWLQALGFTFEGETIHDGETFLSFHRRHHV